MLSREAEGEKLSFASSSYTLLFPSKGQKKGRVFHKTVQRGGSFRMEILVTLNAVP